MGSGWVPEKYPGRLTVIMQNWVLVERQMGVIFLRDGSMIFVFTVLPLTHGKLRNHLVEEPEILDLLLSLRLIVPSRPLLLLFLYPF